MTSLGIRKVKKWMSIHFLPVFKDKKIAGISHLEIENYQFKRRSEILAMPKNIGKREQKISFAYLNKEILFCLISLTFVLKKAIPIRISAQAGIRKLNELSRLKTLSDEDIQKLISGATNKLTRDIITFLIYTGCRKGEALNLKWKNVDLQNGVIAIKGTKTKYDRHIPISMPLKELLSCIEKKDGCELYI